MTARSHITEAEEYSSETSQTKEATESSETLHEAFMKAIEGNPRFQPAKPSGRGFVIVGAKR